MTVFLLTFKRFRRRCSTVCVAMRVPQSPRFHMAVFLTVFVGPRRPVSRRQGFLIVVDRFRYVFTSGGRGVRPGDCQGHAVLIPFSYPFLNRFRAGVFLSFSLRFRNVFGWCCRTDIRTPDPGRATALGWAGPRGAAVFLPFSVGLPDRCSHGPIFTVFDTFSIRFQLRL